jgi:hypothetical protein
MTRHQGRAELDTATLRPSRSQRQHISVRCQPATKDAPSEPDSSYRQCCGKRPCKRWARGIRLVHQGFLFPESSCVLPSDIVLLS